MSEQNKTNTAPKPEVKTDKAAEWGAKLSGWMADAAKLTAPVALLIIAIAIGVFAATQVYDLFTIHLSQPAFSAWLAVLSSVGIAYVMIITMKGWKHPAVQAASTLFAVGYVFIVFALVVLKWIFDAAIQTANITVQSVAQKVLQTAPFLRDFGSLFVVALVGVGLACIAVLVATSKNPEEEFEHENRARSHLIGNTVKIIVSLTSIGLVVLFGYEVLRINIFVTVLLAVILDAGMINAYLRAESAARAGDHRQASVWRIWTAIYAGVVALVAVETVSHFAANSPDIAPAQKAMLNSGVFNILKDIGLLALCGAVGLSVIQLVVLLFSYTNQRRDEDIESGRYTPPAKKGVTLPWRGRVSKPAPAQTQLAQDGAKASLPAGITLADDGPQLEAWRDGDKFAWSVKRGGAVVASGNADTMDAAKAAANQAGGVSTQTVDDDPLSPARKATVLAAMLAENRALMEDVKREPVKGKDYDTTGEVVNAPAKGWPTVDDGWQSATYQNPTRTAWSRSHNGVKLAVYDWPSPHWSAQNPNDPQSFIDEGRTASVSDAKAAAMKAAENYRPK